MVGDVSWMPNDSILHFILSINAESGLITFFADVFAYIYPLWFYVTLKET